MKAKNAAIRLVIVALSAVPAVYAGDLAVNNAAVQGTLRLQPVDNPFDISVRYRLEDNGSETRLYADSDRTAGSWWWRALLTTGGYKPLMVLEGGTDRNSSLWLYDEGNTGADIRLAAKGDSFFNEGRLGVGTATPSAKLEVAGTVKTTGLQLLTGAAAGHVLVSDAEGIGSWQALPGTGGGGGGGEGAAGPAGGDLTGEYPAPLLAVKEGSLSRVSGNAMVSSGGRIGIGTSSPAATLHVAGRTHLSEVLRLAPSARPGNAEPGMIYFDGTALWIYTTKWQKFTLK